MISDLYEYNEEAMSGESMSTGKPQWCKLWVNKYADALDIENLDEDLSQEEKRELFVEVGKAFINALFYFQAHDTGNYVYYKPYSRDGRILWNALKRDIDQSYRDYSKRVADGKKGGRPRKE